MAASVVFRLVSKQKGPPTLATARLIHSTSVVSGSTQAGKYSPTKNKSKPLTYEKANRPEQIAHRKSWNSWNTTTLEGGLRASETAVEDMFIRKFMVGTFHGLVLSEVIIKRQHNIIRIAAIIHKRLHRLKFAFLIGYTEELLGHWLQCPVKLELQFVNDRNACVFKYI